VNRRFPETMARKKFPRLRFLSLPLLVMLLPAAILYGQLDGGLLPGAASADPVIDAARQKTISFDETLPDYIVKQFTTRYATDPKSRSREAWKQLDLVTADVVYDHGRESYANVLDNGKRAKDIQQTGAWSQGEFASVLKTLLSPASEARFSNKQPVTIVNRPAYRYDYVVDQPHSNWLIQANGESYRPSYSGGIWIDKETCRVLRIEMAARDMPREFPLDTVKSSVDYDFVAIEDHRFLLPVGSEAVSCIRGTSECTRNVIGFRGYKKYGADTSITFEGPAKDK
jgi:hypothetical protein